MRTLKDPGIIGLQKRISLHPHSSGFETLFDAIRHYAIEKPAHLALIDAHRGRSVPYAELAFNIDKLAEALVGHGVGPGTAVVVVMPRCSSLIETVLAVSRAGGWCISYFSPRNLNDALSVARDALSPTLFIYSSDHVSAKNPARPGEHWLDFKDLCKTAKKATVEYVPCGETVLYLNETSGSTHRPKLVPATHAAVIANTEICVETLGITTDDIHLCTFASHVHEVFARPLLTGGTAVMLSQSIAEDPLAYVDVIVNQKVTCLMSNATAYTALINLAPYPKGLFSLRIVESGGMPTPESLRDRIEEKFGAKLVPVWGSTETTGVAIAPPKNEICRYGSLGKALPGYEVTIIDENGREVSPGSSGELAVAGRAVAFDYVAGGDGGQLEGLRFKTGDRGMIDKDGWVFINGRLRNEFKVAGVLVSAERIEAAILLSDHVKEVAVLPKTHPIYGYSVVALIVLKKGDGRMLNRAAERQIIRDIVNETEQRLQQPFLELPKNIKWIEELPRVSGGKIDRRKLLEAYMELPGQPTKVRIPVVRQLGLALAALKGLHFFGILSRTPIGTLRLVRTLLRGDKAK